MTVKVGINGFGRVGRQIVKIIHENFQNELEIAAVNSLRSPADLAYLLSYDSTYGRCKAQIESAGSRIFMDGRPVEIVSGAEPSEIPWSEVGAEIVIEATGRFKSAKQCAGHFERGAKKVIISAPGDDVDVTIVMGVNNDCYEPQKHNLISCASCTTNCVAPVAKVLCDSFGVSRGFLSTVHAVTGGQPMVDRWQKDRRRARAAASNIIPTTTNASRVLAEVIPELKGKVSGIAYRVPVLTVSLVEFVADLKTGSVTAEQVNKVFRTAAEGRLKGILEYCEEELVSSDFIGSTSSSIIDGLCTEIADNNMVRVLSWYDNEWGYSCRMADLTAMVAAKLSSPAGLSPLFERAFPQPAR